MCLLLYQVKTTLEVHSQVFPELDVFVFTFIANFDFYAN